MDRGESGTPGGTAAVRTRRASGDRGLRILEYVWCRSGDSNRDPDNRDCALKVEATYLNLT